MTTQNATPPPGAPCWIDLLTSDPERAQTFYARVFDWTVEEMGEEYGNYVNFHRGDTVVAGMMANAPEFGAPDAWTTYLWSSDAQATAEAVRAAGGQVLMEPSDVMDLGVVSVVADPTGAGIGVWQPRPAYDAVPARGETGTPVWRELHTRDHAAAVAFYERAFNWTTTNMSDTDEFRYTVLVDDNGTQLAGIMDARNFLPEGAPSTWSIYFGTDDVDATVATVQELGGAVVDAPVDTPFGRLATVTDPVGTRFKLIQPPAQ
jgi:predicted enzyme related to lactoylglutathione lyase